MAAFGLGATAASLLLGVLSLRIQRLNLIPLGAAVMSLALLPVNGLGFGGLLALWALAGAGQTWVNVPTQILIAERVAPEAQGRVYGAHFAWSHFWWALAYPLAGWLGETRLASAFWDAGLGALALTAALNLALRPPATADSAGQWHEHSHRHLADHHHSHGAGTGDLLEHSHLHFHAGDRQTL
jgi:NRE family putative nickel resistance protein-like MFS transporter